MFKYQSWDITSGKQVENLAEFKNVPPTFPEYIVWRTQQVGSGLFLQNFQDIIFTPSRVD